MKVGLAEVPLLTFRAFGGEVGGIILLSIAVAARRPLRVPRDEIFPLVIVSLISTTVWLICSAVGVTLIGSGRSVLIAYTMPLFSFLFGYWLLKEKANLKRWIGLAFGLTGIAVLVGQDVGAFLRAPAGVLVMLLGAMCWGLGAVLYKRTAWKTDPLSFAGWQSALGALPIVVLAVVFDHDKIGPVSWEAAAGTAYTAVIGNALGVFLWFRILTRLPVGVASLGMLMVPVIGMTLSALFIGEHLGWAEWTAMALIVTGLLAVMPLPRPRFRRRVAV